MPTVQCKFCGGMAEIPENYTLGDCPFCGMTTTFPKLDTERKVQLYVQAENFRQKGEFDQALTTYQALVKVAPKDADVHWGCVLAKFGVRYVENATKNEREPTLDVLVQSQNLFQANNFRQSDAIKKTNDLSRILEEHPRIYTCPLLDDENFIAALDYSGQEEYEVYERQGTALAEMQLRLVKFTLVPLFEKVAKQLEPNIAILTYVYGDKAAKKLYRIQLMLASGDWSNALRSTSVLLNKEPQNPYGYLFHFMAIWRVRQMEDLARIEGYYDTSKGEIIPIHIAQSRQKVVRDQYTQLQLVNLPSQSDFHNAKSFAGSELKTWLQFQTLENLLLKTRIKFDVAADTYYLQKEARETRKRQREKYSEAIVELVSRKTVLGKQFASVANNGPKANKVNGAGTLFVEGCIFQWLGCLLCSKVDEVSGVIFIILGFVLWLFPLCINLSYKKQEKNLSALRNGIEELDGELAKYPSWLVKEIEQKLPKN